MRDNSLNCYTAGISYSRLPVIMITSKSPVQSSIPKISIQCQFGRLYIWRNGWGGTVDRDEKDEQNQSIASYM